MKRFLSLLLAAALPLSALCGCQVTPPDSDDGGETDSKPIYSEGVDEVVNTIEPYITKYADADAADAWMREHILNTDAPPLTFLADGTSSDSLSWEKTFGTTETKVDYPEEAPFTRVIQPITYVCADKQIRLEMTLTTYPGYPVVEYEGTLFNDATGNSCSLSELQAIDERIDVQKSTHILHATRGSIYGATLTPGTDFAPLSYTNFDGEGVTLAVTTGRPSETYLPYFNLENPEYNTGTIAILNWQGSWEVNFSEQSEGIRLRAGQYETDFILRENESARFPGMVLLFYKGDYLNGQNVYRRWIYQCNLFREQGEHMKDTNVLIGSTTTSEAGDLASLNMYRNSTDVLRLADKFNVDAGDEAHGWYDTDGNGWPYVGNWTVNEDYYPNGFKTVSDAVREAGLEFALWFEPERLYMGTKISEDLKDSIIGIAADGSVLLGDDIPEGSLCLLNYADEKAVEYVVRWLTEAFEEYGVDQYRQDYNIQPAPYWAAMDQYMSDELGISRTGLTENHACTGYLTVWSRLLEENPGMYYDACATGGTRYDLSTMRYSFLHTRSDEWANIENAQSQTYGCSMWFLYCGTGFTNFSSYDVRSHISNSIGVAITSASQGSALENALEEWTDLSSYLFYDYYPLTGYAGTSKKTMSLQYDSPEEGRGMIVTYFRKKDSITVCPRGLDPNATYIIWNRDDRAGTESRMLGSEMMAGILLEGSGSTAPILEYCLADGENTVAFQSESVATGLGSTDFDPSSLNGSLTLQKVTLPEVNAVYLAGGMSDEQLVAAYSIEGDNKVAFVGYDYMSAGSIYAISKNLYDSAQLSGEELPDGWLALNKSTVEVQVDGNWYPYTQWDNMIFVQQPYVREINGCYFLWLTNTTGLSDEGGGWSNWKITIRLTDSDGNVITSSGFVIHCEGKKAQRIAYMEPADSIPADSIYQIDEGIFGSFVYTGYGAEIDGSLWYEVDMSRCGYVSSYSKAPDEKSSIQSQTTMFHESDDIALYTQYRDGKYLLYFQNASFMSSRMALVWINAEGEYCVQSFLMN